jgi:CRP-like cAMP-binding protein
MKEALRQAMSQTIPIANDEWEAFEPYVFSKTIKKKENLISEGQICTNISFILRGSMRQYHVVDGEEKTTFFFFDNHYACNYESFLTQQPSDVTIEAMEDCEILYFSREVMHRLYRLYPTYETFGRMIAEGVYMCAMERLKTFLLNSPEERYRRFLQNYDATIILERVPQHYIASYLGITPVSLSRIRSRVAKNVAADLSAEVRSR